ncbi:MAG: S41 family peptidase [Patescibacteria group bacterium]
MLNQSPENKSNAKKTFAVVLVLSVLLSFFIGLFLGFWQGAKTTPAMSLTEFIQNYATSKKQIDFSLFEEVWQEVKNKYVEQPVDEKKLFYGALTGLVASLGDPYSSFLDPELTKTFEDEFEGSFEGIGAEIGLKSDKLMIIAPLPSSPAEKAGLKPQDQILQINGTETTGMTLDYATSLIRGKQGTEVTLLILSEGAADSRNVVIKRDKIKVQSVEYKVKSAGQDGAVKIGSIELTTFGDDTENGFKNAAQYLIGQGVSGFILDLRNNPGGYLETAVSVASQFVESGPIVIEEFSNQGKKNYEATGGAVLADYPVVVLINEGTASASEIVAGALHDYEKAVLIGEKSFGKGSVQEYQVLPDGSSLKITTAKWLTPKGTSINEEGIEPDIKVELTEEDFNNDKDPQIDKAIEIILEKIQN